MGASETTAGDGSSALLERDSTETLFCSGYLLDLSSGLRLGSRQLLLAFQARIAPNPRRQLFIKLGSCPRKTANDAVTPAPSSLSASFAAISTPLAKASICARSTGPPPARTRAIEHREEPEARALVPIEGGFRSGEQVGIGSEVGERGHEGVVGRSGVEGGFEAVEEVRAAREDDGLVVEEPRAANGSVVLNIVERHAARVRRVALPQHLEGRRRRQFFQADIVSSSHV